MEKSLPLGAGNPVIPMQAMGWDTWGENEILVENPVRDAIVSEISSG
jgi:hypothetical protein